VQATPKVEEEEKELTANVQATPKVEEEEKELTATVQATPKVEEEEANKNKVEPSGIDEKKVAEPNFEFVEAWDNFCSFSKAAGFIEDWIRTKKYKAKDFTVDFPAILERAKKVRLVLMLNRRHNNNGKGGIELDKNGYAISPELKNVQQLIFTKKTYDSEDDYVIHFTLNVLEACSIRPEVPLFVIHIALQHLHILLRDGKLVLSEACKKSAIEKLDKIRPDVVFEYVRYLQLSQLTAPDYFEKLAQDHIDHARYAEAAVLIIKFRYFEKFDLLELVINLVKSKEANSDTRYRQILNNVPSLIEKSVRLLSNRVHGKVAAQLVKDNNLNPEDFPELLTIIARNTSFYYIGRWCKSPSHSDYMSMH